MPSELPSTAPDPADARESLAQQTERSEKVHALTVAAFGGVCTFMGISAGWLAAVLVRGVPLAALPAMVRVAYLVGGGLVGFFIGLLAVAHDIRYIRHARRRRRRRQKHDDAGASPIVGAVLVLGVVLLAFAAAVPLTSWCPTCGSGAPPSTPGARWAACELARSDAFPTCADVTDGEALVLRSDGSPACRMQLRTIVDEHGALREERGLACEVLAAIAAAPIVSTQGAG